MQKIAKKCNSELRMPGSAMINLTFKECGGKRKIESEKSVKPRAVVKPFDNRESSNSDYPRNGNVWQNRNKNEKPTGQEQDNFM